MDQNYFSVDDQFFLIDSDNLDSIKSRLYGYAILDEGIVENDNLGDQEIKFTGNGCYVYIKRLESKISIWQDFNGSYGLYFYRNENYFALSNSFFRLIQHIQCRFKLTLNRDYSNHILCIGLASIAYEDTLINEIALLPKNARLEIEIEQKKLEIEYIDYKENTISIESVEGMQILDAWYSRWINIFRNVYYHTNNIEVNLSGGMDSRVTFMLAMKSGIDLNSIKVSSINDNLHTHSEDYKIASKIADKFGFGLNDTMLDDKSVNYSLEDIINIIFYNKMTFHKELYYKTCKYKEKRYLVAGAGGESLRAYWDKTPNDFIEYQSIRANRYSYKLKEEVCKSIKAIILKDFDKIAEKFKIDDQQSRNLALNVHRECRCRSHFGKSMVDDYFSNVYNLPPLLDPELRKLKLNLPSCDDMNILFALIFERYCPQLLEFSFEGNRKFAEYTIRSAKEISNKYLNNYQNNLRLRSSSEYKIIPTDTHIGSSSNKLVSKNLVDIYIKKIFDSKKTKSLFTCYFDEEFYYKAQENYQKKQFYPLRDCYSIIGITNVLQAIEVSETATQHSLKEKLQTYIDVCDSQDSINDKVIREIKDHVTARIDIKALESEGKVDIIEISDKHACLNKPNWLNSDNLGDGYVILSSSCCIDICIRAKYNGNLSIRLRSRDMKDDKGVKIPYWIDYSKLIYNSMTILNERKAVWHDKPILYSFPVINEEIIRFHIEWMPHWENSI